MLSLQWVAVTINTNWLNCENKTLLLLLWHGVPVLISKWKKTIIHLYVSPQGSGNIKEKEIERMKWPEEVWRLLDSCFLCIKAFDALEE